MASLEEKHKFNMLLELHKVPELAGWICDEIFHRKATRSNMVTCRAYAKTLVHDLGFYDSEMITNFLTEENVGSFMNIEHREAFKRWLLTYDRSM